MRLQKPTAKAGQGAAAVAADALPDDPVGGIGGGRLLPIPKLTVPRAARMLGIGETKMWEILRKGGIPVIRIMGKTLVLERDLEAYLQGHYGPLRSPEKKPLKGVPPLPRHVQESGLLSKASWCQ